MFWKFFSRNKKPPTDFSAIAIDPLMEALKRTIAEKKKENPLIGLELGAQEVKQRLFDALKDEKGVHVGSLLTILGSLAGYSCQASIREEFIKTGKITEQNAFLTIENKSGKKFFYGKLLRKPLLEDDYSIWRLAAGAAHHLGCQEMPDIQEIYGYAIETIGTDKFGIPRVPPAQKAGDLPINYVKDIWPKLLPVLSNFCDKPAEWPVLLGLAIQQTLVMAKDVIEPRLALIVVMESAIPMSKVYSFDIDFQSP